MLALAGALVPGNYSPYSPYQEFIANSLVHTTSIIVAAHKL